MKVTTNIESALCSIVVTWDLITPEQARVRAITNGNNADDASCLEASSSLIFVGTLSLTLFHTWGWRSLYTTQQHQAIVLWLCAERVAIGQENQVAEMRNSSATNESYREPPILNPSTWRLHSSCPDLCRTCHAPSGIALRTPLILDLLLQNLRQISSDGSIAFSWLLVQKSRFNLTNSQE